MKVFLHILRMALWLFESRSQHSALKHCLWTQAVLTPWLCSWYLSHWKQANTIRQGLFHTKNPICAHGSTRIPVLVHTFRAQPLVHPSTPGSSSVTGHWPCSTAGSPFNATTCLLQWHPRDTCKHNRWQPPKASCQSIPLTFLFSSVLPLHWDHCPLYWMLRKNYHYLSHEAWTVVQLFSIPWISLWLSDSNRPSYHPFPLPLHKVNWQPKNFSRKNTADKCLVFLSWTLILKNLLG